MQQFFITIVEQAPNLIFAGVGLWLMQRIATRQADQLDRVIDALLEMVERNQNLIENGNNRQSIN